MARTVFFLPRFRMKIMYFIEPKKQQHYGKACLRVCVCVLLVQQQDFEEQSAKTMEHFMLYCRRMKNGMKK